MDREYAVRVRGEVDDEMIERLKAGVVLEDGPAKFTDIQQAPGGEGFNHWYHCVVMEGRNREVRRLWESQGLVVSRLKRVRFGPVFLNSDLPMGRWREMSQYEVDVLSAEVGLTPVAMPQLNAKSKDKLERMQRKSSRPMARSERVRANRLVVRTANVLHVRRVRLRVVANRAVARPWRIARWTASARPSRRRSPSVRVSVWWTTVRLRASVVVHRPVPASVQALDGASLNKRFVP